MQHHASRCLVRCSSFLAATALAFSPGATQAATRLWTQAGAGTFNITNSAYWSPSVPGASDVAYFQCGPYNTYVLTNDSAVTHAEVWFDLTNTAKNVNAWLGSQPWTVANNLDIGHADPASTSAVILASGTMIVTNSSHTGQVSVNVKTGEGGLSLSGGNLIADHLNWKHGGAGTYFSALLYGTLTTLGDSIITNSSAGTTFYLGVSGGQRAQWSILGGSNNVKGLTLMFGYYVYGTQYSLFTNTLLVSGPSTILNAGGATLGHDALAVSSIIVSNGATASFAGGFSTFTGAGSSNALVLVTGSNSVLNNNGQIYWAYGSGDNNIIRVANGGRLNVSAQHYLGINPANKGTDGMVVDGAGSVYSGLDTYIGGVSWAGGGQGFLVVSNGGSFYVSSSVTFGGRANAIGVGTITGPGSYLQSGYNGIGVGNPGTGTLYIANGAVVEPVATLTVGTSGTVTNNGGVFQFASTTPGIAPSIAGSIVLTNGTISFRNVNNVDIKNDWSGSRLTNITFQGNNAFRLNSASNTTSGQNYVFDTGRGATNYARLELVNGGTAYRGGSVTIGAGGAMLVSNTTAVIANIVTNNGALTLANSAATFSAGLINAGLLEASGSTLNGAVTNLAGGTLSPGGTNRLDTLAINGNVDLRDASTYVWNTDGTNGDQVTVNGTLTLPTVATVSVVNVTGGSAVPAEVPLFTATAINGNTNPKQWVISDGRYYAVVRGGTQVVLTQPRSGSIFMIR